MFVDRTAKEGANHFLGIIAQLSAFENYLFIFKIEYMPYLRIKTILTGEIFSVMKTFQLNYYTTPHKKIRKNWKL